MEVPELIDPQGVLAWVMLAEDHVVPAITNADINKANKANKPSLFIPPSNLSIYLSLMISL